MFGEVFTDSNISLLDLKLVTAEDDYMRLYIPTFRRTVMSSLLRIKKPKKRNIVVLVEFMVFFLNTISRQNCNCLYVRIKAEPTASMFNVGRFVSGLHPVT
jgi:hypothetical protein